MRFGAKSGSRILRYFEWSGGSTDSGMSGRVFPNTIPPLYAEEKRPGSRSASSTASRLDTITIPSIGRATGVCSIMVRYRSCGAVMSNISINSAGSIDMYGSFVVSSAMVSFSVRVWRQWVSNMQPAMGPPPFDTTATSGPGPVPVVPTWRSPASPRSWRHASCNTQ